MRDSDKERELLEWVGLAVDSGATTRPWPHPRAGESDATCLSPSMKPAKGHRELKASPPELSATARPWPPQELQQGFIRHDQSRQVRGMRSRSLLR
jgi:hypothetical protein